MNYNINTQTSSCRPDTLMQQVRDGGGALEEPYASVWSACVQSGNTQTGSGLTGLANPAQVHETPNHVSRKANDAVFPGRGLRESGSDTDPDHFGSLKFGGTEALEDHSARSSSEEETSESDSSSSSEEDKPAGGNPHRPRHNTLKKRPGLKIASLNMRGRQKDGKDKMKMVIDWMRMNRIAILALQETHTLNEDLEALNKRFKYVTFYGSGLSTASSGILFLVSDDIGTPTNTEFKNIISGRIGSLKLNYREQTLNIVNIYMPNDKNHQKETLTKLRRLLRADKDLKESELVILGDWNFVEDQMDQSLQHADDRGVMREMTKLKASLELTDGWRKANPQTRSFTWEGTTRNNRRNIFSRIDRIYISDTTWQSTNEYKIINCDVSDHDGIAMTIRNATAPKTGTGEPKLNLKILNHPEFTEEALRLLRKLEHKLQKYDKMEIRKSKPGREAALANLRSHCNPQRLWHEYKVGIIRASGKATQTRRKEISITRKKAENEVKKAEKHLQDCATEEEGNHRKILSQKKKILSNLEEESRDNRSNMKEAKWFGVNEKSSKLWYSQNKSRTAGPIIDSLVDPASNIETKSHVKMLEIARDHHSRLQSEPPMNDSQVRAIDKILAGLTKTLNDDEKKEISKDITYKEIVDILRTAPNGKAPGPDGIPNEFWKEEIKWRTKMKLDKKFKQGNMREDNSLVRPCVAALMTKIISDIERFRANDERFSEARMGLLYKKKDKRGIQNYRPITLLNTDYKTYTKALVNRLREVAPKLMHKDQTGFMPKRSIYNQTKIVELMLKWCENTKTKGAIVCLDQEKAYDRIDLTYLWKVLKVFRFPANFITRIENLYSNTSGTRIQGLSGPGGDSKSTPLKGVGSQQSASSC